MRVQITVDVTSGTRIVKRKGKVVVVPKKKDSPQDRARTLEIFRRRPGFEAYIRKILKGVCWPFNATVSVKVEE